MQALLQPNPAAQVSMDRSRMGAQAAMEQSQAQLWHAQQQVYQAQMVNQLRQLNGY